MFVYHLHLKIHNPSLLLQSYSKDMKSKNSSGEDGYQIEIVINVTLDHSGCKIIKLIRLYLTHGVAEVKAKVVPYLRYNTAIGKRREYYNCFRTFVVNGGQSIILVVVWTSPGCIHVKVLQSLPKQRELADFGICPCMTITIIDSLI